MMSTNKFYRVLSDLQISGGSVIVFENNETEIKTAISTGIPPENIIKVMWMPHKFLIEPNRYLRENIQAFYNSDYFAGGRCE